jgi:hypothetical protein
MDNNKPKLYEPPLPDDERRTTELRIRLSVAELAALVLAAGGEITSTWARLLLLAAAKR